MSSEINAVLLEHKIAAAERQAASPYEINVEERRRQALAFGESAARSHEYAARLREESERQRQADELARIEEIARATALRRAAYDARPELEILAAIVDALRTVDGFNNQRNPSLIAAIDRAATLLAKAEREAK